MKTNDLYIPNFRPNGGWMKDMLAFLRCVPHYLNKLKLVDLLFYWFLIIKWVKKITKENLYKESEKVDCFDRWMDGWDWHMWNCTMKCIWFYYYGDEFQHVE